MTNANKSGFRYSYKSLCDSVENGKINSVNFLLEEHPEWLEEKSVYVPQNNPDKITILVLSAINSNKEMFDNLLSRGASLEPLRDMITSGSFARYSVDEGDFMAYIERIMIKTSIKHKCSNSNNILYSAI